jgi:hypothetical protein
VVHDHTPVPVLVKTLTVQLCGDKGYLSQHLSHAFWDQGLELITLIYHHMRLRLLTIMDKILLRKRSMIEMMHDPLKPICQLEHRRHCRGYHCRVNVMGALMALYPSGQAVRY